MSDPIDGTRGQTPDDVQRLSAATRPTFAAGEAVPGLSSWVLERKLGGGGFGEVWLARHAWDKEQKPRAVKFCLDPDAKNRLVTHERNVVLRVMKYAGKHPNIVPLLDCNLDGDIPWLMYEFVEGGTLASLIKEWRALPRPKRLGRSVRVLHAIAGALGTFHRFDPPLVHRDMKPHNVLMAEGKVPRVTDFGIGGVVQKDGTTGPLTAYAARLPSALHSAGTRLYAPAEQLLGSPPSPRDDVYALGVIAYQMVTADLTAAPGTDANQELRDLKVLGELASLIVRSVAVNPDRRPKDATEWESALAAVIGEARNRPEAAPSGGGSKPVLLPEAADAPEGPTTRLTAQRFEASTPEPTAGPSARTRPSQPPPPPAEPLPISEPIATRVSRSVQREDEPATSGKRKGLVLALGGALILGLVVAIVIAVLASGKRSEPSHPTESVEKPTNVPTGGTGAKGGGTKAGPAEPNGKPPGRPSVPASQSGETREVEIAPGVTMTFCWIPPGTATLGSPEDEKERWRGEVEHEYTCKGFWMGKYEVTQAEWKAVMGDSPSHFNGKKDNKAKGMDTSRFPVESVIRDRISGEGEYAGRAFPDKASAHGGIEKAFGKSGAFRLPTEDEWEYACRGGRGNNQPFYWGGQLNGTEANGNGLFPYGTMVKGQNLERTCAVDSTNDGKYPPHPWGLMHMHGNVSEWCDNSNGKEKGRYALRGGDWSTYTHTCRAAYVSPSAPRGFTYEFIGFRLVVPRLPD
jgi:eukaryotic-like serine/threonine-protein kinase